MKNRKTYKITGQDRATAVFLRNNRWHYRFLVKTPGDIMDSPTAMVAEFISPKFDSDIISSWVTSRSIPSISEVISERDWEWS